MKLAIFRNRLTKFFLRLIEEIHYFFPGPINEIRNFFFFFFETDQQNSQLFLWPIDEIRIYFCNCLMRFVGLIYKRLTKFAIVWRNSWFFSATNWQNLQLFSAIDWWDFFFYFRLIDKVCIFLFVSTDWQNSHFLLLDRLRKFRVLFPNRLAKFALFHEQSMKFMVLFGERSMKFAGFFLFMTLFMKFATSWGISQFLFVAHWWIDFFEIMLKNT